MLQHHWAYDNAALVQQAISSMFHDELIELIAETLKAVRRIDYSMVIHGVGFDEISHMGSAIIVEVSLDEIE